jgi:hypothetical protein
MFTYICLLFILETSSWVHAKVVSHARSSSCVKAYNCSAVLSAGGGYAAPQAARPGMSAGTAGMLGAGGGLLGGMMLGEALEG